MKTDTRFQFCRRKRYKNRGSRNVFWETKVIHDYLRFWFFIYILLTRNYTTARFWGVFTKGLLNVKNATKIGVSGLWGEQKAGPKTGEIDAFKNGVPRSVREWGAYVARREHPVFERIGWQTAGLFFKSQFGSDEEVSLGDNPFCFFKMVASGCTKTGAFSNP